MDWLKTLLIAAAGAVLVIVIWFGKVPAVRRARAANAGRPNTVWWVSLCFTVVVTAFVANQLPDHL